MAEHLALLTSIACAHVESVKLSQALAEGSAHMCSVPQIQTLKGQGWAGHTHKNLPSKFGRTRSCLAP